MKPIQAVKMGLLEGGGGGAPGLIRLMGRVNFNGR